WDTKLYTIRYVVIQRLGILQKLISELNKKRYVYTSKGTPFGTYLKIRKKNGFYKTYKMLNS
ncbi:MULTISPECIES: hypothetical protein, partial [Bacillus cereus group]|uniref:hypothetical protein n=1 Tax=Bacillus cereus group TaxID=86661 RepID=UPI000C024253